MSEAIATVLERIGGIEAQSNRIVTPATPRVIDIR
jgi:hypothetical protein